MATKVYYQPVAKQVTYDSLTIDSNGYAWLGSRRLNPDAATLYFVADSERFYKGRLLLGHEVVIVDRFARTPGSEIFEDKLYVNKTDGELRVRVGDKWLIVKPGTITDVKDLTSSNGDKLVTAQPILDYIADQISRIVSSVTYDSNNGTINVTKNGITKKSTLTGVAHDPTFDEDSFEFRMPVYAHPDVHIYMDRFDKVKSVRFEKDYTFTDGHVGPAIVLGTADYGQLIKEYACDATPLIDTYTDKTTNSIKITIDDEKTISADVIINPAKDNAISITTNGLMVDVSNKANKLTGSAVENHVLVADSDGDLKDSGIMISTHFDGTSNDTIPTSKAVKDAIESSRIPVLETGSANKVVVSTENGVERSSYTIGGNKLTGGNKLATESAVINKLSWKPITV